MKLALVIPCYNEESRLSVESYENFMELNPHFTLFFVDDGSSDQTLKILKKISVQYLDRVIVVALTRNSGKAEAVRQGFLNAFSHQDFDYIGFWDADLATPLSEIARFEKVITDESPWVVFGSRVLRAGGNIERIWYRHILGRTFATIASISTGLPIYDTQCGAKFFKTDISKAIFQNKFISNFLFDIELFLRLKKEYGKVTVLKNIYEMPLTRWKDIAGSKIKPIDFFKAPIELFKMLKLYR